jgi:hypothetical protein
MFAAGITVAAILALVGIILPYPPSTPSAGATMTDSQIEKLVQLRVDAAFQDSAFWNKLVKTVTETLAERLDKRIKYDVLHSKELREIVDEQMTVMLDRFGADRLGVADFALQSAGATIVASV